MVEAQPSYSVPSHVHLSQSIVLPCINENKLQLLRNYQPVEVLQWNNTDFFDIYFIGNMSVFEFYNCYSEKHVQWDAVFLHKKKGLWLFSTFLVCLLIFPAEQKTYQTINFVYLYTPNIYLSIYRCLLYIYIQYQSKVWKHLHIRSASWGSHVEWFSINSWAGISCLHQSNPK